MSRTRTHLHAFAQPDAPSPVNRPTTRPLSCVECSRRKIKCDRKIPCRACYERGDGELCQRQQIPSNRFRSGTNGPRGRGPVHDDILEELEILRERLDSVESVLGLNRERTPTTARDDGRDVKEPALVSAMEEAALGIGENRRWKGPSLIVESAPLPGTLHQWYTPTTLASCVAALPERRQSKFLLDSYCDNLNWMCGCLHRESLQQQHDRFWTLYEQGHPPDGMSLAVLFAVLSTAAFFLDDQQAWSQGLVPQRLLYSARDWFNCSIATFFRCGGLTHHSLAACQTILTLRYAFHLTGNSSLHQQLAYLGLGMARAMNLHLLGSFHSTSDEDFQAQEIGRRVWWLLLEGDWDLLPYHRYCFVSPHHFETALPDLTDEGTLASSSTDAQSLTFLQACCPSARILYDVYAPLSANQYPLYDSVISASKRLDQMVQSLPPEVQQAAEPSQNSSGPLFMWRFLLMMLAYRSYIIHRSFFVKSLSENRYKISRIACVQAAETIINLADKGLPDVFYRLWNTTLWLIAAGLVLGVDLLYTASQKRSCPDAAARRRRLMGLVDLLNNSADQSGIGRRGASLIRHICEMEQNVLAGSPSNTPLTRDDIVRIVRLPNANQTLDTSASSVSETIDADWDWNSYPGTEPALYPLSKDSPTFLQLPGRPAEQSAGMGYDISNSSSFMPHWGHPESCGTFYAPVGESHLDTLIADMLPDPPPG
ncbi:hypothetical protein PV08_07924 [Exophiala spinifera]|uniref:Zn(2)-C6 fungal-type domain-containing protein n=1 Tax=Exophiala spinifera TaxID=91928 RepID=A0A0D2B1D3_9EURO|nr:uncharacterized protein PV08_07924 [Exophiala spinifera]KIW12738.1 hypothetical protein PV08_07924 [Exophiala spinifera]